MKPSRPIKQSHRGHPSNEEYHKLVADFLRSPAYILDDLKQLASLPGVREKVKKYKGKNCSLGKALKELFENTVQQIIVDSTSEKDQHLTHVAIFLRVWYIEHGTVMKAAQALKMTRPYVSNEIKPRAIELVVRQFFKSVEDLSGAT